MSSSDEFPLRNSSDGRENEEHIETEEEHALRPSSASHARHPSAKLKKAPGAPRRFKSSFIFFSSWKHKELKKQFVHLGGGKAKVRPAMSKQSSVILLHPGDHRLDDVTRN